GRWMFSHDGTPRSTIYALDNPAKSIAIPVSRNQVAISFEEMGNEESGPPRPPPSEDRFGGGGPPTPPDTLGSINTGINKAKASLHREERFVARNHSSRREHCNQTPTGGRPATHRRSFHGR